MRNNSILQKIIIVLIITLGTITSNAQIKNPFDARFQTTVRGDLTMISNNILNRSPNPNTSYNGTTANDNLDMQYIDIDGNSQTFNSSSANLNIQDASCSRIVHAGLYWAATYKYNLVDVASSGRNNDWNQVKFRVPGGTYVDITADEVLYNAFGNANQTNVAHSPYACFADVTSLVSGLANPNGTYFVGNIRVSRNSIGNQSSSISGGLSGGWTLVIVYENVNLPGKKITTFDGYAVIASNAGTLDIPVSGFSTLPAPFPVRAKLGVSTLEGDFSVTGDQFRIKSNSVAGAFTNLTNTPPPAAAVTNNYFNSSITLNGAFFNARNPNSSNTLGWDAHLNRINNPANSVIPNNETGVVLRAISSQDKYDVFFTSFDVEVIEPQIPLIKEVEDVLGNNVNNQTLALGQEIFYTLAFQNTGNDDAQNFTLTDVLPTNAIFPPNGTIQPGDVVLPPGVTYVFNPVLNQFVFTIPNNLVEIGDPRYIIKIKVKIPLNCNDFADACTNLINNQAFVSYTGILNPQVITDNPSFNGFDNCNYPTPGTTNFIANIEDCVFTNTAVLCGNTVTLTAPDGYNTYQWQNSSGTTIGNSQTVTVNSTGTYTVYLSVPPPCVSIYQTVTVVDFNNAISSNPAIPYADVVATCPNDGSQLPKIFLCGASDHVLIQSGVTDAVSIQWQQLVPGSCTPVGNNNCANTSTGCTWNTVGTGPNFDATTAGEYQVTFNYQNGCFRTFYFNVFQNVLNPDIITSNIICTTQGTITINNVPSSYQFSLSPTGPFQSSNTFNITTAGVYTVYIQQTGVTGGCLFEYPNINILEQILDVDVIVTDKLCNDGFGSIRVQTNGVDPQYYFQISQGATTIAAFGPSNDNDHLFSNLNPGTYTVTATTDDGCTYTEQVTIQNLANLTLNATISQHIGCNQGNIQMNPNGGQPPYNYAIYSYNGVPVNPANYDYQTSVIFDIQNGQQGTYQFLVIDSNNCTSLSNLVTINLEPPVSLSETHTNVTCNGLNNGTITVQTGPTNGYNVTYSIDGATTFQNSNIFNNLSPGTYTILVRFTKGNRVCEYTINVTITQPTPIVGQSQIVQQLTCIATGSIQAINVSGGTPAYQYSINGVTFQASTTFTGLTAGTYIITIKDANNCTTTTAPITFVAPLPPTDLTFTSTSLNCPTLTSNVAATIVGGTAPYTMQITAPSTINASSITGNVAAFNNLAVGSYTFVVTDANGCTYQENFTINPIPFINVTGNLVSNVVCFGTSTGAVTFNVSNIATNYSYTVNGGTAVTNQTNTSIALTNLAAGNYTIVVTDSTTNCQSTATVTVAQPTTALTLSNTVNPITCIANGSIVANASGGWGSFSYSLTLPNSTVIGPQTSNTFSNLSQTGNYSLSVTDGNGCVVTNNITLVPPVSPTLVINPTSTLCISNSSGATINVTASGGNPPYQYTINSSASQSSNTFTNVSPGSYTITVTDSYGCTASVTQVIAPALLAQAVLTKDLDCSTSPDAVITVNVSGGTTPYQYQVNFNGGGFGALNPIAGTSFTYSTAITGTYQFLITDGAGCTYTTNTITINPISLPTITSVVQTQQILCNGNSNGAFVVNVGTTGTGPYQYSIDGGTTYQNSNTFSGLIAGTYTITIRDNNQCLGTSSITLSQPAVLVGQSQVAQQLTCTAQGSIQVINVSGGTPAYQYSINGVTFQASNIFTGLNAGTYIITIRDANNCTTTTAPITFMAPLPPTDLTFTSTSLNCPTLTSNVAATIVGGTAPYTMQITAPSTINASSITGNVAAFNNLAVGSYTFVVTDANGCTYQENFTINPIAFINVTGNLVSNVVCFGTSTGAVTFNVSNIATNYSYTVNGGTAVTNQTNTSIALTNLAAGNYTIVVTDSTTNCQSTATVTVAQPTTALTLNTSLTPITCNADGSIRAIASGGWGSYSFVLTLPNGSTVGPQNSGIFNNLTQTGNYIITVTDANGCVVTNTITLIPPVNPTLVINPTSTLCISNSSGATINVTASSGNPPYQYNINGNAYQANNTFTNLPQGTYTINVRDSYGCIASVTQIIAPALLAQSVLTKSLDCSVTPDAVITVNVNGGTTPYQYQVNFNGGGFGALNPVVGASLTYSTAVAGTYQFLITDGAGCTYTTNTITINPITLPDITSVVQTQQNLCNGDTNGAFTVNYNSSLGIAPFQFSIDGGTTYQNSNIFTGLTAGTYTVIIRDSKSCTDSDTITLAQPDAITFNVVTTEITCNNPGGTSYGEVLFQNVTGGTQPYTYYLTSNFGYADNYTTTTNENHTFIILNFGIYTAEVIDANGCSLIQSNIIIASPPDDLDIDISTATADCTLGGTAMVTVSSLVSSGSYEFGILETNTLPYTTTWQLADVGTPETATFTGLTPGVTYTFVVHDLITDCYYFETATGPIPSPSNLTTFINVAQNVTCTGSGNGTISFTFDNYDATTTSVSYEIFYAQSNVSTTIIGNSPTTGGAIFVQNFGTLLPGTYYILLTENGTGSVNGCTSTTPNFTITQSTNPLAGTATFIKNINCNNAGLITATGQFGTQPYQYQAVLSTDPAPTVLTFTGTAANTIQILVAGTYIVYIKDANNCIVATNTVVVGLDPSPEITLSLVDSCANEGSFEINITRTVDGIAPYTYVVDGGTPFTQNSTPFTISNLSSGNHTIDIIDSNGCQYSQSITINPIINGAANITVQPSCLITGDGEIQASATNGSTNYTFELQTTAGANVSGPNATGLFTGLVFGTYNVLISDVTLGCNITIPLTLEQPAPVVFTTTHQNVSCNGVSDGSISVSLDASNIDTPYTYLLFDGTTTITQNTPDFTGLPAGNYSVTVTSDKNCSDTQPIVITQPNALTLNATANTFVCNSSNNVNVVTITATANDGTAPYLYSINGTTYQSTNTFDITDNGSIQNFTVSVKDNNGCITTQNVTINPLPTITATAVTQTIPLTCNNDEEVLVTVTGGSGTYIYQLLPSGPILGPVTSNSQSFYLSAAGTYTFLITDDLTGCTTITTPYTINPLPVLEAVASNSTGVSCYGDSNGSFEVTISGYSGNYNYNIYDDTSALISSGSSNTSTNPLVLNGLFAGNYTVQIISTSTPFCEVFSNSITVGSPVGPLGISVTSTNENCNADGIITATGQFGTAPYEYQILLSSDPAPTVATWTGTSNNVFNEVSNSYIVYIKDDNDCITASTVVVVGLDPLPEITLSLVDPCANEGSFTINGIRTMDGIAPYTITVDGNAPYTENATNFTISNLTSGNHTITITDANGCSFTAPTLTINQIINGSATVVTQPSCADNDGVIQANATNGSGNYSFILQNSGGTTIAGPNSTGLFDTLGFGSYTVVVSDATHSCSVSVAVSLQQPAPVVFTSTHENVSCNGTTDGSISVTLNASNIDTPYTYSLFDGTTTITQNTSIFTGLPAGSYTVTVTSSKNCTNSEVVFISEPNPLTLTLTGGDFACNSNNTVNTVTVTATVGLGSGTAPYLYSIDGTNYQTLNSFVITDNGTVQNITISVKDYNNCIISEQINVNPLPTITNVAITQNTALTCSNFEEVLITVTGGSGNFTFQMLPSGTIVGPTTSNTATYSLTAAGSYTFEIVDTVTGCSTITSPYTVNPLPILSVVADNSTPVSCNGLSDGTFTINITGYSGNYNYNIFDDTNTIISSGSSSTTTNPFTLTGLSGGNYSVQIISTDTPFCEAFSNVINIYTPPIPLTLVVQQTSDVTCNVPGLGTITAQANGGNTGTYEYQLVNITTGVTIQPFGANNTFTGLNAGTYEVTVNDSNGCPESETITLTAPTQIDATYVVTNANLLCYNDTNASVTITTTGGQGSYQYTLTDANGVISGPQIENSFDNLGAGIYTVTINDGWNCSFTTASFTVTEPAQIQATLSVQTSLTCNDALPNNAVLLVTASGGTPPYSINGTTFNSTITYTVGPGTYQYNVTDANGCTAILTNSVTIAPIPPLLVSINASTTTILCNGDTTSITAIATGGLGNYTYTLLNATTMAVITGPQTSNIFNLIGAGNYIVRVNSGNCVQNSNIILITQPSNALSITNYTVTPALCNGSPNGTITFNPTGGTPPYQYAITNHLDQFFTTNTFTDLAVGTYNVVVQDSNGCFETITVEMTEPAPLVVTSVNTFELCEGNNDGTATLTIIGGTAPYSTNLDDGSSTAVYVQDQLVFTNLDSTVEHTIYVLDANGCPTNINIPAGNPVSFTVSEITAYACTSSNPLDLQENTVTVSPTGAQYEYALDMNSPTSYQTSNVFTDLSNGLHTIYVKHTNGCIKEIIVNITNWIPVTETHTQVNVLCNAATTGSITAVGNGGNGTYQYAISPNFIYGTANTFNNLAAGTYTVKVKDGNNCEIETPIITITQPTVLNAIISGFGQDQCIGDNFGFIQVDISGGVGPYMASFNNTNNYQVVDATNTVYYDNLAGGATYTVYIKDTNGCVTSVQQTLDPAVDLNPSYDINYDCSNNQSTNSVTITVDSQYLNDVLYSIDGTNYQTSNIFVDVAVGSHTIYVDHINGCLNTDLTFTINPVDPVFVTLQETGLNQITATATGGVPPYTYIFNGINTGSNNVFIYSQTGDQTVVVYDSNVNPCSATATIPAIFYPIEIPNFFTPDGNGFNDFWTPINIENFTNIESLIFDRYGREIIRLKLGESWNGTYESTDLPSGDYWYLINVNDGTGRAFTGNFTLYR